MYPTSENFKNFIYSSERELRAKAEIDLSDGTHLTLDNHDILESGFEIEDAVSDSDKFEVGSAIISQLTLVLNNFENKFSSYDLIGAVIKPYVGLVVKKDWQGNTIEWIPKGVFIAEKPTSAGSRITITALDNMSKLDTPYSKSPLKYPSTLSAIATDVCSTCGVSLESTSFLNSDYSVATRPSDSSITCREIISYVAQLAGCFARCNKDGAISIRWYENGDTLYDVGTNATESTVADSDTVVNGIQIQGNDDAKTVYSSGTDGFIARIKDNPLAQDNLKTIANALGSKLNGYTFRQYTVTSPSNPAIEAGDIVKMTDRKGNTHTTIVSRMTYKIDGNEEYNADSETLEENKSERFSKADKAQDTANQAKDGVAKANVKIGDLEVSVQGKVSISDLAGDGTTVINGANITTGRISSEDGSWWLDLETGEVYMKKGTFSGNIKWLDDDGEVGGSITYAQEGGLHIDARGPMTLGASGIDMQCNIAPKAIWGLDVEDSVTGNWNIKMADGTEHRFHFVNGNLREVE